jgi:hypothetical protein
VRNPQRQLYATLAVALLLTGCGGDGPAASAPVQSAASLAAAASPKCQKLLSVMQTNDEHLQPGEKFRISGPNSDGDYRLRTLGGGHAFRPGDHDVVKSSSASNNYSVDMEFDSSGCPSKLHLDTIPHEGDAAGQSHGGDAVMN